VTVAVDAVVYYRISNPRISVVNVENAARSTQLLAQTTLRNILGTKTLSEILTDRESISSMMQVNVSQCQHNAGLLAFLYSLISPLLCGRPNRPHYESFPAVRPLTVSPARSTRKSRRKVEIGENVAHGGSSRCANFQLKRSKVKVIRKSHAGWPAGRAASAFIACALGTGQWARTTHGN